MSDGMLIVGYGWLKAPMHGNERAPLMCFRYDGFSCISEVINQSALISRVISRQGQDLGYLNISSTELIEKIETALGAGEKVCNLRAETKYETPDERSMRFSAAAAPKP